MCEGCKENIDILVEVTTKLSDVHKMLESEVDCSVAEVGKMMAEAGRMIEKCEVSVMETIEIKEEYELMSKVLYEFIELDECSAFENETIAMEKIMESSTKIFEVVTEYELVYETKEEIISV